LTFDVYRKKTDEEFDAAVENCSVMIKLLRVDADRVCVDFTKVSGSSWYFFELYNQEWKVSL
jgi:hypothetical protein